MSHIDGTGAAPPRRIAEGTMTISNPAFEEWFAVDKLLVGWLRNTTTVEVRAQLLHCKTAQELWTSAKELTCASMKSRVMVIKTNLHQTRKGNLKMEEYLAKMKGISNQLTLAGAPIAVDDLILHTLNGLDADYNPIIVKLIDQANLTWVKASSTLLAFKSRLEQLNHFSTLSI